MYRPPKDEPKGRWARHLHEQRRLRDLSQMQAFELLFERMSWSPKSRASYVAIDMGTRQPSPSESTILGAEFGWPPDPEINDELEDPSLATALVALAGELRASREERVSLAARLEKMEAVLDGLVQQAMRAVNGPHAPHETSGSK
jgi:hypothetical protein